MLLSIDPSSESPLFAQVAAAIRAEIAAGRLRTGDRLPAAHEIATALGVNLHTVLHAYQDLRDEGLVHLRRGRGATITDAAEKLRELAAEIDALAARAKELGLSSQTLAELVKNTFRQPAAAPHEKEGRSK